MKIFYQISKSFVQSTLSLFSGAFQAQTNRTAMTKKSTQHCVKQLLLCLLVCMGTIATNAQSWPTTAPVISYAGPQYYNQNVTITPLLPSNSNAGSIPGNYPFAVNTLVGTGTAGKVDGTSTASFSLPTGIAKDGNGNLYIADAKNNLIRKITKAGVVITLAGDGYKNVLGVGRLLAGNGTAASFDHPTGLVVVGDTCIYVADNNNNVIRKIRLTSPYAVTTFAGFLNGSAGSVDATGNAAKFSSPQDITVDAAGNLYVVDNGNNKIRKITTAGAVTSFAGSGTAGNKDSTGILATFKAPTGIAIDAAGNLYIADNGNNKIRKITAAGVVTSYAGIGIAYTQDGVGRLSYFNGPESVTIDKYNNLYVTEDGNYVRKVTPAGVVTTIAGTGVASSVDSTVGKLATFNQPAGIAIDAVGDTLYIADTKGNIIRTISLTGYSITPALPAGLSFNGATGTISGTPTVLSSMSSYLVTGTNAVGSDTATVSIKVCAATNSTDTMIIKSNKLPYSWDGLTFTAAGTQTAHFINAAGCDSAAIHTLIIISCATSSSTTILLKPSQLPYSWNGLSIIAAGTQTVHLNNAGCDSAATLIVNLLPGISYTGPQTFTIAETIAALAPTNNGSLIPNAFKYTVSTIAGSVTAGNTDGIGTAASFYQPEGVALDATGNIYVADAINQLIRKISQYGTVSTFASTNYPQNVALDTAGNVYVASAFNVEKITADGTNATTLPAGLTNSFGIAFDAVGNMYFCELGTNCIKKMTTSGTVSIFAGSNTGASGYADGAGTTASFNIPKGLTIDKAGNLYVADYGNNRIRKITAAGMVTTINCVVTQPTGLVLDITGDLIVSIPLFQDIYRLTISGQLTALAGSSTAGYVDNVGIKASFNQPFGLAIDNIGNIYVADRGNNSIRKVSVQGYSISPALPAGLRMDSTGTILGTPTVQSAATTYTIVATNQYGSDTTTVSISVIPNCKTSSTNHITICSNALPYSWNGLSFTAAGTQTAHLTNKGGCDSAATLVLNVNPTYANTTVAGICSAALPYSWNGRTYSQNKVDTIHYSTVNGCDSVEILNLTVVPQPANVINYFWSCGSFTWNGTTYTQSGTYKYAIPFGSSGKSTINTVNIPCVDTAVLVLTLINNSSTTTINSLVSPYTWNGVAYTLPGTYTVHLTNVAGCDSAATLNLSFAPPAVTYPTPQVYSVNKAISILVPTNAGTAVPNKYIFSGNFTGSNMFNTNSTQSNVGALDNYNVTSLAEDKAGNVYATVANMFFKVNPAGVVSSFAGSPLTPGNIDSVGTAARFNNPQGVAVDTGGNIYVADKGNNKIRKITPLGVVSTFAGSTAGSADGVNGTFNQPISVAVDNNGYVYVLDAGNNKIRKISPIGDTVSTLAGSGAVGAINGIGTAASFTQPNSICVASDGTVFVTEPTLYSVRKITAAGVVSAFVGGTYGTKDSVGVNAQFLRPRYMAIDMMNNLYVTDSFLVRKISPAGQVNLLTTSSTISSTGNLKAIVVDTALNIVYNDHSFLHTSGFSQTGYIGGGLPKGLKLNIDGTISGTPNLASTAKLYTIYTANKYGAAAVQINITVNDCATTATITAAACESYSWHGNTYTVSGSYTFDTTNVGGCDSLTTLNLTISHSSIAFITQTACGSYTWHGNTYTVSGSYTFDTTGVWGCDSLTTLNLTINQVPVITANPVNSSICTGGSTSFSTTATGTGLTYQWKLSIDGGTTYNNLSNTGIYSTVTTVTLNLTNATFGSNGFKYKCEVTGCSLVTTSEAVLTVKNAAVSRTNATVCSAALPYSWNGRTYSANKTDTVHFTAANGCDSAAIIVFTVTRQTANSTTSATACSSYVWHGQSYTASGIYTFTSTQFAKAPLSNNITVNCVDTAILILTIKQPTTASINATACGNYSWHGSIYTASGTYTFDSLNNAGCDSLTTLNLTINNCNSNYVWTGTTSTDWSVATNWSNNVLPTAGVTVTIPSAPSNQPALSADVSIGGIILNGTTSLNGHIFTINGTVTGTGKLKGSATSSLVMNSSSNNTINFGTSTDSMLANLTINGTGTVTLGSGLGLTNLLTVSSGVLNTGNHLTLKSTSIVNTAVVDVVSGSISGKVTVERNIPKGNRAFRDLGASVANAGSILNNWQEGGTYPAGYGVYITGVKGAAPGGVDAATGLDKTISGNPSLYTYGAGIWPSVTNTKNTNLDPFMGYRASIRGDRTYNIYAPDPAAMVSATTLRATGNLVTGNVVYNTTNVTSSAYTSTAAKLMAGNNSFSFVANPYACPIDWELVYANSGTTNLTPSYWYFDPTFTSAGYATYVTYNATPGVQINSNPTKSKLDKYIQPGMAFFVQNSGASPTLSIKEANKAANSTKTAVFRNSVVPNYVHVSLWKTIKGENSNVDGAVAVFNNNFTKAIGEKDSKKLMNGGENLYITQSNTDLSIAGLPVPTENEEIELNLSQLVAGTSYQLQLNASQFTTTGIEVFIVDKMLNTVVPAEKGISFTPTKDATTYQGRFSVVFRATKVNPVIVKGAVSIYPNPVSNSKFNLQMSNMEKGTYTVRVLNNLGQEMMNSTINNEGGTAFKTIATKGLTAGVYTVQVVGKTGSYTTELIVR